MLCETFLIKLKQFETISEVIEILWDQITFEEYNEVKSLYIDKLQEIQVMWGAFGDF